ncbi:MAG TPA: adenylate/guanylate cyclase domain-containing protein [Croceibacterium sp.]|nr:adenylate/guanylate cyclase domain-containing protein [Croceibacterium sp.]
MAPAPPPVVVYSGHMFEQGCAEEPALAGRIAAALDELGTGEAFGPLACGADILIAEAVLARGGRLEVVLPFAEDDFIAESVTCGGESWLARYRRCREAAHAVHFATPLAYVGDDNQFYYNTRFAMGLAALRARELGSEAVQLAVASASARSFSATGLAGTAADIGIWERLGKRTIVVDAGPVARGLKFPCRPPPLANARREIRSILFADYKGFSRLGERELPLFMREVMGRIGAALDRYGRHVEFRNTWGDAVYAIVDEPGTAAHLALELQRDLRGLPDTLSPQGAPSGMRIGLHYGPIYVGSDRVTAGDLWYGGEVNRTARIEPVTPMGDVYCTEAFASALILDGVEGLEASPLGERALAKDFGTVRLFRLAEQA